MLLVDTRLFNGYKVFIVLTSKVYKKVADNFFLADLFFGTLFIMGIVLKVFKSKSHLVIKFLFQLNLKVHTLSR